MEKCTKYIHIYLIKRSNMFQITQVDIDSGLVLVEDKDLGLWFEFNEPELKSAVIIDNYDLHITTTSGQKKLIPILTR